MVTHLYHPDTGFTTQLNLCAELPLGSYKCQMTYFHARHSVWFIEMSNDIFPPYRIIDNSLKVLRMSQCGLLISTWGRHCCPTHRLCHKGQEMSSPCFWRPEQMELAVYLLSSSWGLEALVHPLSSAAGPRPGAPAEAREIIRTWFACQQLLPLSHDR